MSAQKPLQLHQYAFDPLDRHVSTGTAEDPATHLFYCRERVATEIRGDTRAQVFECEEAVLAYRVHQGEGLTTSLIAGDTKRSTLSVLNHSQQASVTFTPYGHQPLTPGTHRVPGFNGERPDPLTGHYLLGNGYRAFNPILMRFNSPDRWSPFGKGGINAYAYCLGDPINRIDPDGNISVLMLNRAFTIITQRLAKKPPRTWVFANSLDAIPENKAVTSFTTRIDKSQLELTKDLRIFPRSQKQNLKLHTFIRKNKPLLVEFVESNNLDRKREIVLQLTAKKSKKERKLTLNIRPSPDNPTVKTEGLASSIRQ